MEEGAPSSRSRNSLNLNYEPLAESVDDVVFAARVLMQLREGNNYNSSRNNNGHDGVVGKSTRDSFSSEEADQSQPNEKTIGDDIEVVVRPRNKKKYRSLGVLYKVTKPIKTHP